MLKTLYDYLRRHLPQPNDSSRAELQRQALASATPPQRTSAATAARQARSKSGRLRKKAVDSGLMVAGAPISDVELGLGLVRLFFGTRPMTSKTVCRHLIKLISLIGLGQQYETFEALYCHILEVHEFATNKSNTRTSTALPFMIKPVFCVSPSRWSCKYARELNPRALYTLLQESKQSTDDNEDDRKSEDITASTEPPSPSPDPVDLDEIHTQNHFEPDSTPIIPAPLVHEDGQTFQKSTSPSPVIEQGRTQSPEQNLPHDSPILHHDSSATNISPSHHQAVSSRLRPPRNPSSSVFAAASHSSPVHLPVQDSNKTQLNIPLNKSYRQDNQQTVQSELSTTPFDKANAVADAGTPVAPSHGTTSRKRSRSISSLDQFDRSLRPDTSTSSKRPAPEHHQGIYSTEKPESLDGHFDATLPSIQEKISERSISAGVADLLSVQDADLESIKTDGTWTNDTALNAITALFCCSRPHFRPVNSHTPSCATPNSPEHRSRIVQRYISTKDLGNEQHIVAILPVYQSSHWVLSAWDGRRSTWVVMDSLAAGYADQDKDTKNTRRTAVHNQLAEVRQQWLAAGGVNETKEHTRQAKDDGAKPDNTDPNNNNMPNVVAPTEAVVVHQMPCSLQANTDDCGIFTAVHCLAFVCADGSCSGITEDSMPPIEFCQDVRLWRWLLADFAGQACVFERNRAQCEPWFPGPSHTGDNPPFVNARTYLREVDVSTSLAISWLPMEDPQTGGGNNWYEQLLYWTRILDARKDEVSKLLNSRLVRMDALSAQFMQATQWLQKLRDLNIAERQRVQTLCDGLQAEISLLKQHISQVEDSIYLDQANRASILRQYQQGLVDLKRRLGFWLDRRLLLEAVFFVLPVVLETLKSDKLAVTRVQEWLRMEIDRLRELVDKERS
ncbi:hypothetical protein BD289DRAFT_77472 [Coniella lustricola]|uniref:Ubiquitin-like protease family profile domain-containing protein n=1 Tax=Coniella lustricola TaxID=2025994 RepID=A0A2T2ZZG5_9PEZI|nr:hypothetical protein BD289DRAFT_77472 [Coniella lustricola]